jgi:hypothetical protein
VPIKPTLEAASYLPVSAPEEPDMALARGAALASANAPLFASSTAALAYAQDPGTGEVDPYAVSPGYLEVPVHRAGAELHEEDLAYSAAPDQDADAQTGVVPIAEGTVDTSERRRPLLLAGSALAVVVVSAALALEIALALGIRPAVALRPTPGHALIAPAHAPPSPPVARFVPAPPRALAAPAAPLPVRLPAPAPMPPRAPVPVPIPVAPVPVPVHVMPAPPVHVPFDQPRVNLGVPRQLWRPPNMPPMHGPQLGGQQLPQPPMNFPGSQGSRFPQGPQFGDGPRFPDGPQFPNGPWFPQGPHFPTMPGPVGPRFGGMPGPMFPRMPGPMMPAMPRFNFPFPSFRH